mgnify:CR=1 FL=1
MISTYICTIFYFISMPCPLFLWYNLINDKTMKCISAFLSLCLIAAFVVAQPNYDFSKLKREHLGRGVIAIRENPSTVAVSWRYLSSDPMDESFDIYRNGEKVNTFLKKLVSGDKVKLTTTKPAFIYIPYRFVTSGLAAGFLDFFLSPDFVFSGKFSDRTVNISLIPSSPR